MGYFQPPWIKRNRDLTAIDKMAATPDPALTNLKNLFTQRGANPAPSIAPGSMPSGAPLPAIHVASAPKQLRFGNLRRKLGV